jgi:CubicO group peptidase (beta-lactamase class C family)
MIDRRFLITGAAAAVLAPFAIAQTNTRRVTASGILSAARYSETVGGASFVAQRGTDILHETYSGIAATDALELASATKSFSGVMLAALTRDGRMSPTARVSEFIPEWRGDRQKQTITVKELLSLTSGLPRGTLGQPPTYPEAIAAPLAARPGTEFLYGPTAFQVFGAAVKRVVGDPQTYLQRRILDRIGVSADRWRRDENGDPHLPSGAHFTARALSEFGVAVLAETQRRGELDLDPQVLAANFEGTVINPGYGLTWWLLKPGLKGPGQNDQIEREAAAIAAIDDIRMAAGAGNQRLYVLPRQDLIVVRQARLNLRALRRGRRRQQAEWSDLAFLRALYGLQ